MGIDLTGYVLDIIKNSFNRIAKEANCQIEDIGLSIIERENDLRYDLYIKQKFVKKLSFNEILGVKIDFLGREKIIKPYLLRGLDKCSKKEDIIDLMALIKMDGNSIKKIRLFICDYSTKKMIKELTIDYLLTELK